jgi:hypothetical protein
MRAKPGATGPFLDLNATFFPQTCRKRVRSADSTERFLGGDSRSGIFSGKQALEPRSTPHTLATAQTGIRCRNPSDSRF